ncbi:putative enoyl CoA hydratase [Lobulomyces angularis]|nr:putative enoyl CoA hydratase [Lobulomyces angularis]
MIKRLFKSFSTDSSSGSHFVLTKQNAVATLTFNRPKSLNALTEDMGIEFEHIVRSLSQDHSLRALILTGNGKGFSAGGDLNFLRSRTKSSAQHNSEIMRSFYSSLPFPTIAAINGHAVGAGFCVSLACDFRIASENAKMGFNFVKIGLAPGMAGSHILPQLIGIQEANRLILTGELITAEEARSTGLLLKVVKQSENHKILLEEAGGLAKKIISNSPVAVRATLKTLRMKIDDGLERALQREADSQAHSYSSPDYIEGLDALVEKRNPDFKDFK